MLQKGEYMHIEGQPITHANPDAIDGESTADFCRRMGWEVGTVIAGNEGYGTTAMEITAIGEEKVLTKFVYKDGSQSSEHTWTHVCRHWKQIN